VVDRIYSFDGENLERLISELEQAAISRHWTRLKKARQALKEATGIEIIGPLRQALKND
jgi:hypothetical protein